MAIAVGFEGSNNVAYGYGEVRDLQICQIDGPPPQIISAWRLSPEELAEVAKTGVVWVSLFSISMPPLSVSGTALVTVGGVPSVAEPIMPWKPARGPVK